MEQADTEAIPSVERPVTSGSSGRSDPPAAGETETDTEKHFADTAIHAAIAQATLGISPISLVEAYFDWLLHLAVSPGRRMYLAREAGENALALADYAARAAGQAEPPAPCVEPAPGDRRFRHADWRMWPFNIMQQSFLLSEKWWHEATRGMPGVRRDNQRMVDFYGRQLLDMTAPSNFPASNPEVIAKTLQTGGTNFVSGGLNWLDDLRDALTGSQPAEALEYQAGRDVAVTPGAVVFRNDLIELIQYAPTTETVRPQPILISPAWIMKYYILDLSPENSLIRYLVSQGFTVFTISWVNPDAGMRETSFDDYRKLGLETAIDAVCSITGAESVHGVGYCLGGTLFAIEAARMARDGDRRLASLSLFAAQVDFSEAGELTLFINESQVALLDDMMRQKGYLDASKMAGAFQFLRSQDLVWSRMVRSYLMGERAGMNDLMAWNADATRMPHRMHSQYLRQLFLNNDLAEGRFRVHGRPIFLEDIRAPVFAVATERDHVSPWKSVFKLLHLLDTDITFLLTSGGHNAGIVSEPGHRNRRYRVAFHEHDSLGPNPEGWLETAEAKAGSWWPEWVDWLQRQSGDPVAPPTLGASERGYPPLEEAPGTYVFQT